MTNKTVLNGSNKTSAKTVVGLHLGQGDITCVISRDGLNSNGEFALIKETRKDLLLIVFYINIYKSNRIMLSV